MKKTLTTLAITALALLGAVSVPAAAHAGGTEPEVTCEYVGYGVQGGVLKPGAHINLEYKQQGQTKQVNAQIDRNIQGGYDTLGIRINGHDPIPLTEAQVKAGAFSFDYAQYIDTTKAWQVLWVQFEAKYHNQDRDPSKFIHCEGEPPIVVVPEKPEPVTTVKDEEAVDCDTRTATKTTTTTVQDWKLIDNTWVPAEPQVTVTTQDRPATEIECELPEVGVNTAGLLWTLGGGLALVGAGVALNVKRRRV